MRFVVIISMGSKLNPFYIDRIFASIEHTQTKLIESGSNIKKW